MRILSLDIGKSLRDMPQFVTVGYNKPIAKLFHLGLFLVLYKQDRYGLRDSYCMYIEPDSLVCGLTVLTGLHRVAMLISPD